MVCVLISHLRVVGIWYMSQSEQNITWNCCLLIQRVIDAVVQCDLCQYIIVRGTPMVLIPMSGHRAFRVMLCYVYIEFCY